MPVALLVLKVKCVIKFNRRCIKFDLALKFKWRFDGPRPFRCCCHCRINPWATLLMVVVVVVVVSSHIVVLVAITLLYYIEFDDVRYTEFTRLSLYQSSSAKSHQSRSSSDCATLYWPPWPVRSLAKFSLALSLYCWGFVDYNQGFTCCFCSVRLSTFYSPYHMGTLK